MTSQNITLKEPENSKPVEWERFSPEEKKQAEEIAAQVDVYDSKGILTFGIGAQKEIAQFSDTILDEVRTKDSGYVGEILSELSSKVKEVDVDNLSSETGFIEKIPLLGNMVNKFKRFVARYQKIGVHIDKIVDELEKARMSLIRDITLMDRMYEKNSQYLKNLEIYIAAGERILQNLQESVLPPLKEKADESNEPGDAQQYQDARQFINRFDKKIHDLKLSRMIAIQATPQIRLIQNGNQELVEKIQSSVLNTIPLWKNQIAIAITLFRQKRTLNLQKEVSQTTNELLEKNMELLKQGTLEIAKESERGIVEIETLKKVNDSLVSTIEETLKIQEDGRLKRRQAEVELQKIETDLKERLISLKPERESQPELSQ